MENGEEVIIACAKKKKEKASAEMEQTASATDFAPERKTAGWLTSETS